MERNVTCDGGQFERYAKLMQERYGEAVRQAFAVGGEQGERMLRQVARRYRDDYDRISLAHARPRD